MDIATIVLTALITWVIEKSSDAILFLVMKNIRENSYNNNEDE
jgi:hypothetical protein